MSAGVVLVRVHRRLLLCALLSCEEGIQRKNLVFLGHDLGPEPNKPIVLAQMYQTKLGTKRCLLIGNEPTIFNTMVIEKVFIDI